MVTPKRNSTYSYKIFCGKLPKTIVLDVLQESGGFEGVQGQNNLVGNREETYNAKLRVKQEKDEVARQMRVYIHCLSSRQGSESPGLQQILILEQTN